MKQLSLMLFPALAAGALFLACKDTPTPKPDTPAPVADTVRVDPVPTEGADTFGITEGMVYWQGKKSIGMPHNGTIKVSGGKLLVNQGRLLSGSVTLDMRSIAVTNLNDGGEKADLESHLKDKDFFEVGKYPEATFVLTEIMPSTMAQFNWVLRGDLTIKGNTHPVNVPAILTISENKLEAQSATFIINRTKWGLNFRSGSLGTAKDKIIEDVVPLSLKVSASKIN